uniref:Uncharacterized protein n=1 Tax=viral metagenome TaxID=1070528 RepID=A0A6M3J4Y4_9ZZZZ
MSEDTKCQAPAEERSGYQFNGLPIEDLSRGELLLAVQVLTDVAAGAIRRKEEITNDAENPARRVR